MEEIKKYLFNQYAIDTKGGQCVGLGLVAIAQSVELLSASIHRASVGLMAAAGMLTMDEARAMFGIEEKK